MIRTAVDTRVPGRVPIASEPRVDIRTRTAAVFGGLDITERMSRPLDCVPVDRSTGRVLLGRRMLVAGDIDAGQQSTCGHGCAEHESDSDQQDRQPRQMRFPAGTSRARAHRSADRGREQGNKGNLMGMARKFERATGTGNRSRQREPPSPSTLDTDHRRMRSGPLTSGNADNPATERKELARSRGVRARLHR